VGPRPPDGYLAAFVHPHTMAHPKRPASAEEREQRAVIEKLADTYPLLERVINFS
jgi:hypothetical protein